MRVGRKLPMSFIDKLGVYIGSPSRRHNMTYASKEQTYFSSPFRSRCWDYVRFVSVLLAFDRWKVPEILRTLPAVACVVFVTPVITAGTSDTQHHVVFQTVHTTSETLWVGYNAFITNRTECYIQILFQCTLLFKFHSVTSNRPTVSSITVLTNT